MAEAGQPKLLTMTGVFKSKETRLKLQNTVESSGNKAMRLVLSEEGEESIDGEDELSDEAPDAETSEEESQE